MKNYGTSTETTKVSHKDPHGIAPRLEDFLADQDDATKDRYANELANSGSEWGKALEMRYADSLVYFGLLERQVTPIMSGPHVRGSRTAYRRINGI